ncbi:hypothetical protein RIF29_08491 [Crotalaria pallida]|uniref:Uncharacterized protein n=1 Tax=Crotalaria pallida TaxID=3830 RepID=A0AAN9FXD6_CROPI
MMMKPMPIDKSERVGESVPCGKKDGTDRVKEIFPLLAGRYLVGRKHPCACPLKLSGRKLVEMLNSQNKLLISSITQNS